MKIVATSDWHIGAKERKELKEKLHKMASDNLQILTLVGGDVYHSRTPGHTTRNMAADILRRFSQKSTTVVVSGNHDSTPKISSLEPFKTLAPQNLHIITSPSYINYKNFSVVAIPWIYPTIAAEGRQAKAIENLISLLRAKTKTPRFLVAHASIFGTKFGEYRDVILGNDILWQKSFLDGFDFCCIGHIHKPQIIAPNAVYTGSPQRLTFGERNEDKGYYTWEDGHIEFHSLNPRPMFWFKGTQKDIKPYIENCSDRSVVRATFQMKHGENKIAISTRHLHRYDGQYEYPRKRKRRTNDDVVTKTPLELLQIYLDHKNHQNTDAVIDAAKKDIL